jgi:hypothetical protein
MVKKVDWLDEEQNYTWPHPPCVDGEEGCLASVVTQADGDLLSALEYRV